MHKSYTVPYYVAGVSFALASISLAWAIRIIQQTHSGCVRYNGACDQLLPQPIAFVAFLALSIGALTLAIVRHYRAKREARE